MCRWSFTIAIMICLRDYYCLQIMGLLYITMFWQLLVLLGRPMETKADNYFAFFNELMVTLYLYTLIALSDFSTVAMPFRDECGWLLVFTIMMSTAVNIVKFLITVCPMIGKKLRKSYTMCMDKLCQRDKLRKYQMEQE